MVTMWRSLTLVLVAAGAAPLAGPQVPGAAPAGAQGAPASSLLFAHRADASHVVATLSVVDASRNVNAVLSDPPRAKLGYAHFDPPAAWRYLLPDDVRAGERWRVAASPSAAFTVEVERLVGGEVGCNHAIGVLLRVVPEEAEAFAKLETKYFLAQRAGSISGSPASRLGAMPTPASPAFRAMVEARMTEVLARELPGIRAEAAPHLARAVIGEVASRRAAARARLAIDEELQAGRGVLTYDIQSYRLSTDGPPVHFVRAEWKVGTAQAVAAAVWLRGTDRLDEVEAKVRPTSWLQVGESAGRIVREHLGLVLNVFDADGDGWGEILLSTEGYESRTIALLELTPDGFRPAGVTFAHGC